MASAIQKIYRAAIYLRLSREDGNEESQSISSQKEILTDYVTKQGWNIVDIYIDDVYICDIDDETVYKKSIKKGEI